MRSLRIDCSTRLTVHRDMNIMRSKLTELGFDVPRRRYGIGDDSPVADENDAETSDRHDNGQPRGMWTLLAS